MFHRGGNGGNARTHRSLGRETRIRIQPRQSGSTLTVISCCQNPLHLSLSDPRIPPSHPLSPGSVTTITISPRVAAGLTELRKVFRFKAFWVFPQETHLYFRSTLPYPSPLLPVLEETAEAKGHEFEN